MAKRAHLDIDISQHINDVVFSVFRSLTPYVDESSTHIMDVTQNDTIKVVKSEVGELLKQNPDTPFAFQASRHYDAEVTLPKVYLAGNAIDMNETLMLPMIKEIELHGGQMGIYLGDPVTMDYDYVTQPVTDDYNIESGKQYLDKPILLLSKVNALEVIQDFIAKKFQIKWEYVGEIIDAYYRIYMTDTAGQRSVWSDIRHVQLFEDEVLFRIQTSDDGENWQEETVTSIQDWFIDYRVVGNPQNIRGFHTNPISSKKTELRFLNPWNDFMSDDRVGGWYRVRAEDARGEHTEWVTIGPITVHFKPEKVLIRRKIDNGSPSSYDGTDAFSVFELDASSYSPLDTHITILDDQLTDKSIYSYTVFYEDEMGLFADPIFKTSDHMKWTNLIVFNHSSSDDEINEKDFFMEFFLHDEVIKVGINT